MPKRLFKRLAALGTVGVAALIVQACFPAIILPVVLLAVVIVGVSQSSGVGKKPGVKTEIPISVSGEIGGLDGTFDLTLGDYGTISGTADIKGQKAARLKAKNDEQTAAVVEAIVLDQTGVGIDVTKSKTVFKGSQTTGGVEKRYKIAIKWKGQILDGPDAGKSVRGAFKTKGSFE